MLPFDLSHPFSVGPQEWDFSGSLFRLGQEAAIKPDNGWPVTEVTPQSLMGIRVLGATP